MSRTKRRCRKYSTDARAEANAGGESSPSQAVWRRSDGIRRITQDDSYSALTEKSSLPATGQRASSETAKNSSVSERMMQNSLHSAGAAAGPGAPIIFAGRRRTPRLASSRQDVNQKEQPRMDGTERQEADARRGVKRKANQQLQGVKRAQRVEVDGQKLFMDEKYVRNTFDIPTHKQYPQAPAILFRQESISSCVNNLDRGKLKVRAEFTARGTVSDRTYRCTIHCTLPDGKPWSAVGDGTDKVCFPSSKEHVY